MAHSGRDPENDDAEQIHLLAQAERRTRYGEGRRADQLQNENEQLHLLLLK